MLIDNIVVGNLVEGLTLNDIGISEDETTISISNNQASELGWFLPRILVVAGIFKTTSQIKTIDKQRRCSKSLPPEQILWRTLDKPEMTSFKIGKNFFWLVVGDLNK